MHSAFIIAAGIAVLIVLCAVLVSVGPRKYRVHQVSSPIGSPFASPFALAVQMQPKYWPWWISVSVHETQTDAEYALQVLAKQRKASSAHPAENASKLAEAEA